MEKKASTPDLIMMIAGAVALIGSFLPWIDINVGFGGSVTQSAWSDFLFPTYAWVGIFGGALAVLTALRNFGNVSLPANILGFSWNDVQLILSAFAALIAISFVIAGEEFGIGFWLSLLAAVALVVGAWMARSETKTTLL